MSHKNNLPQFKNRRRELRKNLTPAEAKLWSLIKGKQFHGIAWRRQFSVSRFILDFYCPDKHLAIELDGQIHNRLENREHDEMRTIFLQRHGVRVIRFENRRIFEDWENVEKEILLALSATPPPR